MIDYEKITARAKSFAQRKGFPEEEAEDFAQQCAIKAFELGHPPNFEYMYLNHCEFERADKRILSGSQGAITGFRTISLATPVNSSESDSATIENFIEDQRDEFRDREELSEIREIIEVILGLVKCEKAKAWAEKTYTDWIEDNAY